MKSNAIWIGAILLAVGGCRGRTAGLERPSDGPIGIALLAEVGADVGERGARLAVDRVNRDGGLRLGGRRRRLELEVTAVSNDPQATLDTAIDLLRERRLTALLGPRETKSALSLATLADANGIPLIIPADAAPASTHGRSFVFRTTPRDVDVGLSLARLVSEELAGQHVAVVYDESDPRSRAVARSFRVGTTTFTGELSGFDLSEETGDVRARLLEARVDAIALLVDPEAAIPLAEALKDARVEARLLGIDLGDANRWEASALEDVMLAVAWHEAVPTETSNNFVRAFSELHGAPPSTADALAYDAVGLLCEAMTRADTDEPGAVQRSLRRLEDYRGVSGTFSYMVSGEPAKPLALIDVRGAETSFRRWLSP